MLFRSETITSSALASGSYNGSITITAPTATNSPQVTSVALTVNPAPTISIGAGATSFTGARFTTCNLVASGTAIANQTFVLTNSGDATLNYTAAASTSSGGSWLSVSPLSGAIAAAGNATITESINLAPGGVALAAGVVYLGVVAVGHFAMPTAASPDRSAIPLAWGVGMTVLKALALFH